MRVANIQNSIINRNYALRAPSHRQNFCGAKLENKVTNDEILKDCTLPDGCIDFRTLKTYYTLQTSAVKQIAAEPCYIIPEKYIPVIKESEKIISSVPVVINKFSDIHPYAKDIVHNAKCNYVSAELSEVRKGFIDEFDNVGNLKMKTVFDRNGKLKLIKDYKNNAAILFDKDKPGKKYTVFVECKNIDDPEYIEAEESFTFEAGLPYQYTTYCKAEINPGRFLADEAYNFRNHSFKSYDKNLTVAGGAEYSSAYYEFDSHPGYVCDFDPLRCNFKCFVKDKVAVNDRIYYSADDFLISQCKRMEE